MSEPLTYDEVMAIGPPWADAYEFKFLYDMASKIKMKNVLEVGIFYGGAFKFWINLARPHSGKMIGIEKDKQLAEKARREYRVLRDLLGPRQSLHLIFEDSTNPQTVERVKQILDGEKLDFLYIDGDHNMPAPKLDFENYSPLVRHGGIIAFHDISGALGTPRSPIGEYFASLCIKLSSTRTIPTHIVLMDGGMGTGIIIKNWDET